MTRHASARSKPRRTAAPKNGNTISRRNTLLDREHLDDAGRPSLRLPLNPRPLQLESRWTDADAAQFIDRLADFARKADVAGFMQKHRDVHEQAAKILSDVVNRRPIVPRFDNVFGTRHGSKYVVFIGLLNGQGNYGVSFWKADSTDE